MFLEACRGSGAHSSWPARAWCLQDLGTEIPLLCSAMLVALKKVPTWCPKLLRSCIPIGPKWSQKGAKRKPKWCQHGGTNLQNQAKIELRGPKLEPKCGQDGIKTTKKSEKNDKASKKRAESYRAAPLEPKKRPTWLQLRSQKWNQDD